ISPVSRSALQPLTRPAPALRSPVQTSKRASVIRFGVFEINRDSGELRKSGTKIKLQEQPFKILEVLVERPGEVVTREELRRRIWPEESFGDFDHAVNVAVGKLRTALSDSAEVPRMIETLPRRGYRFIAPVKADGASTTPTTVEHFSERPPGEADLGKDPGVTHLPSPETAPTHERRYFPATLVLAAVPQAARQHKGIFLMGLLMLFVVTGYGIHPFFRAWRPVVP